MVPSFPNRGTPSPRIAANASWTNFTALSKRPASSPAEPAIGVRVPSNLFTV